MNQSEGPILKFCYIVELSDLSTADFTTLQENVKSEFWKQSLQSKKFREIGFNGYMIPFLDSGETWQKLQNVVSKRRKKKRIVKIPDLEMDWINQIVNHCLVGLASDIAVGFQEEWIRMNDGIEFKIAEMQIHELKQKLHALRSRMDKERGINHYNNIQILGNSSVKGQPRLTQPPHLTNQAKKKLPNKKTRPIRKLTPVWPVAAHQVWPLLN